MTTYDEELRALKFVNDYLIPAILDGSHLSIPRVPKELKELARRCYRHYPTNGKIETCWWRMTPLGPDGLLKPPK